MIPFTSKRDIVSRMLKAWVVLFTAPAFAASWSTFQDPNEQAFTVEVPQGWTVNGGMFRLGYSDYRVMVDLRSPDGKASIRLGDVSIPTYAVPSQLHPQEGSTIDLGAQAQMTVARYRTGRDYALAYSKVRFKDCKSLVPRTVAMPAAPAGPKELAEVKQATEGEATYACDASRTAYVYVETASYGPFWQVHQLRSFEAPSDQVLSVSAIIDHAVKTFKIADPWVEHQKQLDQEALVYQRQRQQARMRQLSAQVAQFEMKMQAMRSQVSAFEHRMQTQQAQVDSFDRALRGVTATVDPLGNPYEVQTGSKDGYWTDGLGHYANSNTMPGPGWKRLTPVKE